MRKRLQGNRVASVVNGMLETYDDVTRRQRKKKLLPEDSEQVNAELRKAIDANRLRSIEADLKSGDGKSALEKMEDLRESLERVEKRMDGKKR